MAKIRNITGKRERGLVNAMKGLVKDGLQEGVKIVITRGPFAGKEGTLGKHRGFRVYKVCLADGTKANIELWNFRLQGTN